MHKFKGIIAAVCLVPLLTACTAAYQDLFDTIGHAVETLKTEDVTLSAEEVAAFPYSALYATRGNTPRALIVLGYIDYENNREQRSWISSEKITLVTEGGRIIKTAGLIENISSSELGRHDLLNSANREHDPLHCIVTNPSACPREFTRTIEFIDRNRPRSAQASSTFSIAPERQTITLASGEKSVYHVIESGTFSPNNVAFRNEFWLEADGHVVRSTQTIMPNDKAITLEQVKWVGRDE